MSQTSAPFDAGATSEVHYPESDGKPMADNTLQYKWVTLIRENLDRAYPDAFVAADLIWYPVQGRNDLCRAPDVLVAIGRHKGERGSYRQWEEGGVAPQVVFEIWSTHNTLADAVDKHAFYERHGVEEYYLYNPNDGYLAGWTRQQGLLVELATMVGHRSARLGITFAPDAGELRLVHADGRPFLSYAQVATLLEEERARADQEQARADQEQARADQEQARADRERERADQAAARAEALAEKLRALGVEPD